MNLKDYEQMPDEGLFEKIERRLRVRRVLTVAVVTAVVAAVASVAVWMAAPHQDSAAGREIAAERQTLPEQEAATLLPAAEVPATEVAPKERMVAAEPRRTEVNKTEETPVALQEERVRTDEPKQGQQPVSPRADVKPVETPVAELVPVTPMADSSVTVPAAAAPAKGGQQVEQQPHYDNILWAPNAILPDGDNDRVRQFKVIATSAVTDYRIHIYNRGGRQVYTSTDINAAWDATFDGERLPQGTYVWVARFRDSDGVVRQEKGTVTVVR